MASNAARSRLRAATAPRHAPTMSGPTRDSSRGRRNASAAAPCSCESATSARQDCQPCATERLFQNATERASCKSRRRRGESTCRVGVYVEAEMGRGEEEHQRKHRMGSMAVSSSRLVISSR
eukprot:3816-Chlamydomonas_euryale.AAC.1